MTLHVIIVPGWHPTCDNELKSWKRAIGLKAKDRNVIARAVLACGVPEATCKRKVSVLAVMEKGQRCPDPTAYWKSLLDSLVEAGALKDDNRKWCDYERPNFARQLDDWWGTVIYLEDLG